MKVELELNDDDLDRITVKNLKDAYYIAKAVIEYYGGECGQKNHAGET